MEYQQLYESCNKERLAKQHARARNKAINGENIYIKFVTWCLAFKGDKAVNSPNVFAEFLKAENIELDFWQRKHIAEKYFGYRFTWNSQKSEWEITR